MEELEKETIFSAEAVRLLEICAPPVDKANSECGICCKSVYLPGPIVSVETCNICDYT